MSNAKPESYDEIGRRTRTRSRRERRKEEEEEEEEGEEVFN